MTVQIWVLLGMIADHCRNLGRVGKIETLQIFKISPRPSHTIGDVNDFEFSLVGKIYMGRSGNIKFPVRLGFSDK